MTRREATLQILIEVTAQPEAHLKKVIEHLPVGGPVDWDAEMTTEERAGLLASAKQEASGILALYVKALQQHPELMQDRIDCIAPRARQNDSHCTSFSIGDSAGIASQNARMECTCQ